MDKGSVKKAKTPREAYKASATESEIQNSIFEYLRYKPNCEVFRTNAGDFIVDSGKGKKRKIQGLPKGFPDLMVFITMTALIEIDIPMEKQESSLAFPYKQQKKTPFIQKQRAQMNFPTVIFIEVKSAKGKQTKEQKEFQEKFTKLGYNYFVFRSLDECIAVFK